MFNGAMKFAGSVAAITLVGIMVLVVSCAPYLSQRGYPGAGQVAGGGYQSSPTPPLPTATPDQTAGWKTYSSAAYGVSLRYPPSWERDPRYNLPNSERYDGSDGFFMLSASNANTIDEAAQFEVDQKLRPYGSNPTVTKTQVQGQDARLIMPSSDQAATMDNQAALIVLSPQPIRIGGTSFKELILWADKDHVQAIAGTLRFATPTAAAADLTTTPESGARITLTPDSGPPGMTVEIEGYLPDVHAVVTNSVDAHADICWARCPGGLQDEGLDVQWSTDQPGRFTMRFTVPAASWLDNDGIHALTAGDYVVGVQCLAQPTPVTKGPGFVPCTQGPAQAIATFHLTGPTPTECTVLPCGRLSLSPDKGPPGTLVTITGWAPLDSQIFGDRPFGYYLALQRPGAASDNPWLGQVQQALDGSLSGSFLVPVAFGSLGELTPGPYTLYLEALLTDGTIAARPLPGLTVIPLGKGGSVLGARVTFAPTPFTVTAAPTWASLGQLKPLWSQWSAQLYGGAAIVGDPADPQRLAYCAAGGIRVSSDGGGTWKTISTDGAVQAVAGTEFEFIPNDPIPPACSAVALDPAHPASFYATFAVVKKPQKFPPPENLIGLVTSDDGQTWESVPSPPGYSLEQYGGFQTSGQDVQALFGERANLPDLTSFAVENTSDGGRTWSPRKLTCPASGPCVRWGPAPSSIGGMGVGYPQPVEVSIDGGQSWTASNNVFLNQGPSELAALSQTDVVLLSGFSPYPLVVSHDAGRTWEDVALPGLGPAGNGDNQYPELQILTNGSLLARGEGPGYGLLMLVPRASQWCELTGASLPASVSSFWAIGDRLWWVQMGGTPTEARMIGSVSIADLTCGQAIPPTEPTPVTSATNHAPIAPAVALDAVFSSQQDIDQPIRPAGPSEIFLHRATKAHAIDPIRILPSPPTAL